MREKLYFLSLTSEFLLAQNVWAYERLTRSSTTTSRTITSTDCDVLTNLSLAETFVCPKCIVGSLVQLHDLSHWTTCADALRWSWSLSGTTALNITLDMSQGNAYLRSINRNTPAGRRAWSGSIRKFHKSLRLDMPDTPRRYLSPKCSSWESEPSWWRMSVESVPAVRSVKAGEGNPKRDQSSTAI